LVLLVLGPLATASLSPAPRRIQDEPRPTLSAADKEEIVEVFRLKKESGDNVWPGFAAADIPLILFDEHTEFLAGEKTPPAGWTVVEGDAVAGLPYFRRAVAGSQAFAVKTGTRWAGSMGTLEMMNGRSALKLSPDFHIAGALHEMFHAFEAEMAPARFKKAQAAYKSEPRYPFKDKEFAIAWKSEGAALSKALKAADSQEAAELVRTFLALRDARRSRAGLSSELMEYERDLEWLEGLAKYAEVFYCERFSAPGGENPAARPRPGFFPLIWDYARLANNLGDQEGDLRFYLSGMAQARLLDRTSPGWKEKVGLDKVFLEDLLRVAVQRRVGTPRDPQLFPWTGNAAPQLPKRLHSPCIKERGLR
jgi:hypothetical protein